MSHQSRLAVLIPAYNGGSLLRESVLSCASAGLAPEQYEIFVVDNCSTDASVISLPKQDPAGARITVVRNESNRGRVANWNRALEIAESAGFDYAAFLFVGDTWIPGGAMVDLLRSMDDTGAVIGMAPINITSSEGALLRFGKRVAIDGAEFVTSTQVLLEKSIVAGHIPFAPIQANVYRLHTNTPLRFDPNEPMSTDIEATLNFLKDNEGRAAIISKPFLAWRLHENRFYAAQDGLEFIRVNTAVLERASTNTGIPVNWSRANTILFLNGVWGRLCIPMPLKSRFSLLFKTVRYINSRPGRISPFVMLSLMVNKLLRDKSYIAVP